MSQTGSTAFVVDEGDLRKYRTEVPNMIYDMNLDPYTGWLYSHIKRIAGDSGICERGTRSLAEVTGMSMGQVVKSKQILKKKKLIRVVEHPPKSGLADEIYVTNIWRKNFEHFDAEKPAETRSPHEHPPVHVANTPRSPHEHPCSPGERKKEPLYVHKERRSNERPKNPEDSSPSAEKPPNSKRVEKLSPEEAGRRFSELCEGDPNGGNLGEMAELLAEENATGKVAATKVWRELGARYLRTKARESLSDEAWAYGFEQALARAAPNIGYALKAAKGYNPDLPMAAAGTSRGTRRKRSRPEDYDEGGY